MLEGEPLIEEYKDLNLLAHRNNGILSCLECLVGVKYPRLGRSIKAIKKISVHEYVEHVGKVHEMQQEFIQYWRKNKLDFLIAPGFASEASTHGSSREGSLMATYTYIFNILRVSGCTQPVTVTRGD